jgi:hypothetical protein
MCDFAAASRLAESRFSRFGNYIHESLVKSRGDQSPRDRQYRECPSLISQGSDRIDTQGPQCWR